MLKFNKIYFFLVASIFILLLDWAGLLNFIKRFADQTIIPVKKAEFQAGNTFKNLGIILWSYPQLTKIYEQRNDLLKNQEELQFKLRQAIDENAKLRTQLESPFPSSYTFVIAQVIGISKFMEIEGGSDQGLKTGQIVVDGQILVGKVIQVTPRRSKVILLNDPDFSISAVTNRGTYGEIVGQSGDLILLSKVLQKDPLFLSDQVITTGAEFTPPNLLIGKIAYITADETATYKQAKIAPLVNLKDEKKVFVITSL